MNFSDFKTSVYHLHLFYLMRVNSFPFGSIIHFYVLSFSLLTGVPVLFFGPKGVRLLLTFRGFCGYGRTSVALSLQLKLSSCRFFALVGMYYSLQYLSLPDATVLTFLAPLCTGMAGALFLREIFTRRQALAGN